MSLRWLVLALGWALACHTRYAEQRVYMTHPDPSSSRACSLSQPDPTLLPSDFVRGGFKLVEPPRSFVGDRLFDLIDGGAVQYFDYGFQWALSGTYSPRRGERITVELYRMATSEQAHALYEARDVLSAERVDLGDDARIIGTTLEVCDACCLVTVSSFEPGERGREQVVTLGYFVLKELHRE